MAKRKQTRRKPLTEEELAEVLSAFDAKVPVKETLARHAMSNTMYCDTIAKHRAEELKRRAAERKRRVADRTAEAISLREQGWTYLCIAAHFGVSSSLVRWWIVPDVRETMEKRRLERRRRKKRGEDTSTPPAKPPPKAPHYYFPRAAYPALYARAGELRDQGLTVGEVQAIMAEETGKPVTYRQAKRWMDPELRRRENRRSSVGHTKNREERNRKKREAYAENAEVRKHMRDISLYHYWRGDNKGNWSKTSKAYKRARAEAKNMIKAKECE